MGDGAVCQDLNGLTLALILALDRGCASASALVRHCMLKVLFECCDPAGVVRIAGYWMDVMDCIRHNLAYMYDVPTSDARIALHQ
jgi:hypothetical protein